MYGSRVVLVLGLVGFLSLGAMAQDAEQDQETGAEGAVEAEHVILPPDAFKKCIESGKTFSECSPNPFRGLLVPRSENGPDGAQANSNENLDGTVGGRIWFPSAGERFQVFLQGSARTTDSRLIAANESIEADLGIRTEFQYRYLQWCSQAEFAINREREALGLARLSSEDVCGTF